VSDRGERSALERLGERIQEFLASRTADHWIMFLAGLVVGLILG
jgi:hypothetical protein